MLWAHTSVVTNGDNQSAAGCRGLPDGGIQSSVKHGLEIGERLRHTPNTPIAPISVFRECLMPLDCSLNQGKARNISGKKGENLP
jgi:hypothetical protein